MPTKLAADILKYSDNALKFQTAAETLNALDDIVREHCHIRVLGAVLMPVVYGDTEGIELEKPPSCIEVCPRAGGTNI